MRILSAFFVTAMLGCGGSPKLITVEPEELVTSPGTELARDTEAALEIGWDQVLQMGAHPRPRITWFLPCVAPTNAAGDVVVTYAESCSANSVNGHGDVALQWSSSIASSSFPWAVVGYKGYVEGYSNGYSGDRADIDRVRAALTTAGL